VTISVVIPTLNEEQTIIETLSLTARLGFEEIIVVDGGSTDQTRARAQSLGLAQVLISQPGRARQLNAGAQVGRGDVLLFLHADTHLPPSAKSRIEAALENRLAVGGRFDVQFDIPSVWSYLISALMNIRSRLTRISTGDQALFVRKEVFEQLGGYSDIPIMEDIDLTARLKRRGPTIALRERVTTSFRRWQRQGPLKTILLMWMLRLLYWLGVNPHRLKNFYVAVR
jgi:rSAM/selenodomain-associated transferase 2